MPLDLHWPQVFIRIALALFFSFIIGLNRDEHGHPAGIRTTMLVCLAATLAQLQANLLLPTAGKTPSSFSVLDLERLPLGILSGIGFIGAGVIMKRDHNTISGVTTAATIWLITVLGLLFGGGQLWLGVTGGITAVVILWALKHIEGMFHRRHSAKVHVVFSKSPDEDGFRGALKQASCSIKQWKPTYKASAGLTTLECELSWDERANREPHTPKKILGLVDAYGVDSITWDE
jgi:putative Mg2+ transporter-C (MgtC) family protein